MKTKEYFIEKVKENQPQIYTTDIVSDTVIELVEDSSVYMGVGSKILGKNKIIFDDNDKFILDFGNHYTGQLSFKMEPESDYLDAPLRLKFRFGETPYELSRDFDAYVEGLSRTWLQEAIVDIDHPGIFTLPRRYSFRYVEVTVVKTPRYVKLTEFTTRATTSADISAVKPLPENTEQIVKDIDRIAIRTMSECMQQVYEDGPKRDRRLWIGDLRVQALTNYMLFKDSTLVTKCLYLFAACANEKDEFICSCAYHTPDVLPEDRIQLSDYALLYAVTLCDYFEEFKDTKTAIDLYDIAKKQVDISASMLDENGIFIYTKGWSKFIDWQDALVKQVSLHGVYLYTLEKMINLAKALGKAEDAENLKKLLTSGREAALKHLFNDEKQAFVSDYDENQYSVHAQVWMVLGGVVDGEAAVKILKNCMESPDSIKPVTPYMHHYVLEAMFKAGMKKEAWDYVLNYWGGMVKLKADTFWEVYVPNDQKISPYGDNIINSMCHAWSCSASYFIRKYLI
ncbi:MAG: sugar hydrolase [Clostridia bacterium]|nr:sugar hydrolase [Clostridia bacterium]